MMAKKIERFVVTTMSYFDLGQNVIKSFFPHLREQMKRDRGGKRSTAMDLMEAIYSRRAVREFALEPIDEKTLRQLMDAAKSRAHMLKTSAVGLLSHSPCSDPQPDQK